MTAEIPDYGTGSLDAFLEQLASRNPAPGAGAAAAVTVGLAAGLAAMAARSSTRHLPDATELADEADRLRRAVLRMAGEDAAAYAAVLLAGRSLETGGDVQARRVAEARQAAVDIPVGIAEAGVVVAGLALRLRLAGHPHLNGDAEAAIVLADAAVQACVRLVQLNVEAWGLAGDGLTRADECRQAAANARAAMDVKHDA